jgi:SsrA-binding protein
MELAKNKKALFDYEILEKFQAGLVLSGQEVKSAKNGQISLKGAFVTFHAGKPLLTGAHITKYKPAGDIPDYDPTRSRHLLLKKKEIRYLQGKFFEKGLTIVPLSVYTKNRFIKVEIAVARGKKTFDKREVIKKRDANREIKRAMKKAQS